MPVTRLPVSDLLQRVSLRVVFGRSVDDRPHHSCALAEHRADRALGLSLWRSRAVRCRLYRCSLLGKALNLEYTSHRHTTSAAAACIAPYPAWPRRKLRLHALRTSQWMLSAQPDTPFVAAAASPRAAPLRQAGPAAPLPGATAPAPYPLLCLAAADCWLESLLCLTAGPAQRNVLQ